MKVLFVFIFILSGCATFTYRNISVYNKQVDTFATQTQMKQLIDYAFEETGYESFFNGYNFVFTSAWLSQYQADGSIIVGDGQTILKDKIIFLKVRSCFADSAIIHEMAHVVHFYKYGNGDQLHENKAWWDTVKTMSEKMVIKFCHKSYVRNDKPPTSY